MASRARNRRRAEARAVRRDRSPPATDLAGNLVIAVTVAIAMLFMAVLMTLG